MTEPTMRVRLTQLAVAMMALLGKKQRMIRTLEAMKPPKELQ